jgi:hypothetical protein
MMRGAGASRLARETLYGALSPGSNPEFATVLKVVGALGLRLHAGAARAFAGSLRTQCPRCGLTRRALRRVQ